MHAESDVIERYSRGLAHRVATLIDTPRYAAAASFMLACTLSVQLYLGTNPPTLPDGVPTATHVVRLETSRSAGIRLVAAGEASFPVLLVEVPASGSSGH